MQTYDRLVKSANSGNIKARTTLKAINDTSEFMIKRRYGTPMEQSLLKEKLSEAAVESNPWLAASLH